MCRSNFEDAFSFFVVPLYFEHVKAYFSIFQFRGGFLLLSNILFSCEEVIRLKERATIRVIFWENWLESNSRNFQGIVVGFYAIL